VNEFDDVKSIAEDIDELGYNVEYTLDAFENLSKSLKDSKVIGLFVLLCVLLIAIVNIILSSENYLRTSQKDMGILLHYGYDRKVVKKIYLNNFIGIFVRIAIGVFILNILVSSIFVRQNLLANCTIICFIIAVILFVVFIIVRQRLYRYLEKDILDLIKFSKEIE
jgi:ABC-type lipoprotein release transport system permease subunit